MVFYGVQEKGYEMSNLELKGIKIEEENYSGYVDLSFECPYCGELISELKDSAIDKGHTTILYRGKVSCSCVEKLPITIVAVPKDNKVTLYWGTSTPIVGFLWNPINMFMNRILFGIYKLAIFMMARTVGVLLSRMFGVRNESFRKTHS